MALRRDAEAEFHELLIANYDFYEREKAKPRQLTLFGKSGELVTDFNSFDYERILKECVLNRKGKKRKR